MDRFKDAKLKTEHTANAVENNREKFDDYMYEQKNVLVNLFNNLDSTHTTHENFLLNEKVLKNDKEVLYKSMYKVFASSYDFIKREDRSMLKVYFKTNLTDVKKLKDIRYALNNALVAIDNPAYNLINDDKSKLESALEKIEEFLLRSSKQVSDKTDSKEEYDKAYDLWYIFYHHKIKNYYKGYFADVEDEDYRDYFLDLSKPSKSKKEEPKEDQSKKEESKKEEPKKEEPKELENKKEESKEEPKE